MSAGVPVPPTDPAVLADASARMRDVAGRIDELPPRLGTLLGEGRWTGAAADGAGTTGHRIGVGLRDTGARTAGAAELMERYQQQYGVARQRLQRISADRAEVVAMAEATERQLSTATHPEDVRTLHARREHLGAEVNRLDGQGAAVSTDLAAVQASTAARLRQLTPDASEPVLLAQLRGTTDAAAFDAIPSWWPTRYQKRAIGRDDYAGHKVYFQIPEVTKSRDGKFVYVKGQYRAAAYGRGLPVPTRIETSNTITIKGSEQTGRSWALGGFGGGAPPTIGANAGGGSNWVNVNPGNDLKISYPARRSVERNFTAAIQIPRGATEIIYKASATFVYRNGRTESREIPVSIPLH